MTLKYSAFYPVTTGVSGTALPATRNAARGDWAVATAYNVGDIVQYGGSSYIVATAHTSTGAFDASKFYLFAVAGGTGPAGLNNALIFIYKRSASFPTLPTVSTTYTFNSGILTGLDNGWTQTIPGGSDPLYVAIATASATTATDSIAAAEWASPSILAQNGATGTTGTNGLNNALVYIYKRSATAPSLPTVSTTYTFATGGLVGLDNGWTSTVPAGSNPLYVSLATASSITSTDTIANTEWTAATILVQDGATGTSGTNGSNGLNVASVFLYQRAAASPAVPSVTTTFTFATGVLTSQDNGWSQTIPGGSNPLYVTTATASATTATDTIATGEWASVNILAQNGATGTTGLSTASIFLYKRSVTTPALPSTTSTFTFSTGVLTGHDNGWTQIIPAGTDPLYVTTATASANTTTDTIANTEWAATTILVISGNIPDIKFIRSNTTPSTPTGDAPAGWSDGVPSGASTLWMVRGDKNASGVLVGLWSTPQQISGIVFRGAYDAATAYSSLQSVTYSGGTYVALGATTGNAPTGTAQANAYWDVIAAPGAQGTPGTAPSAFTATITMAAGAAINLRTLADTAGYTGASNATITYNVPNGVTIRGLTSSDVNSGGYGIDTGTWPTGYTIALTLVVQSGGIVDGGGGRGGDAPATAGRPGGDAIYLRVNMTGGITVNSGGIVRGGGGGGGSGNTRVTGYPTFFRFGGNGGGGGFPNGAGGLGEVEDTSTGSDGSPGTTAGGGAAGTGGSGAQLAGAGGGIAAAGTGAQGNAGGVAGYAVRKAGFTATVTNNGTLTGTAA